MIDTLELLSDATEPRTIAQIADALGISRPTMSAILAELDDAGWIVRDASRGYRLGAAAAGLSRGGPADLSAVTSDVLAVIEELADATGCGATLSRFSTGRMTVVAKVHSRSRPVPGLGLGQSLATGYPAGAAVMAGRDLAEQTAWTQATGVAAAKRRRVLDVVHELGYAAYRPASTDASLIESLADLLGAVGPMLIDPGVRRSATRQLAELSSRAYRLDDLDTDEPLPLSYLAAPVARSGVVDVELQLGVLRSAVTADDRRDLGIALVEAAARVGALWGP
ncbi:MarR family transcriptional regulator [Gordonia spumicola]|uniref:MarR family transcriptional regulator n=1 Tax=Gordonia spumicola TaxID=589161 RepID=UPI00225E4C18|nr:MarR family transcriptional regulator [Gordonia spumicola]